MPGMPLSMATLMQRLIQLLCSNPDAETDKAALPWPQGERKGMQGQIFELQKQLTSALALNSRLRSRNALLERSAFLCAGPPKEQVGS